MAGRKLWQVVVEQFDLPPESLLILQKAAEAEDRAVQARNAINRHGLTMAGRFGEIRVRPEIAIGRHARAQVVKFMSRLGLNFEPLYSTAWPAVGEVESMATNRRRKEFSRRGDVEPLDGDRAMHLAYGYDVFGGGFTSADELLRSWAVHGAVILPAWLERFPGYRPFAWWFEVAPRHGERRILPGQEHDAEIWREGNRNRHFGLLHTETIPPIQESQTEFLERKKLFVRGEQARIESGETPWSGAPNLWHSHLQAIYESDG